LKYCVCDEICCLPRFYNPDVGRDSISCSDNDDVATDKVFGVD
jgi:hypothetical protein